MTTVDALTGFAPFDRLATAQREAVAATGTEVAIDRDTTLFVADDPATGCWLIRSGQVSLRTFAPGRGEEVLQTLGPGDVLGWSWLVPPRRWHFSATADTAVTAMRLDTDRLHALAAADPALGYPLVLGLFEVLLARLQTTRARLLDFYRSPREEAPE